MLPWALLPCVYGFDPTFQANTTILVIRVILQLPPYEPTEQQPTHDYLIPLSGTTYRLVWQWRDRTESWYLSLYDADDILLVDGIRAVVGYPLGWRYTGRIPTGGKLMLVDTEGTDEECDYEDFGNRCKPVWITDDEIPEAEPDIPITIAAVP